MARNEKLLSPRTRSTHMRGSSTLIFEMKFDGLSAVQVLSRRRPRSGFTQIFSLVRTSVQMDASCDVQQNLRNNFPALRLVKRWGGLAAAWQCAVVKWFVEFANSSLRYPHSSTQVCAQAFCDMQRNLRDAFLAI